MNLLERARALQKLGFLPAAADLPALVTKAQKDPLHDARQAPATALLAAAGVLLSIEPETPEDTAGFRALLERIAQFCGGCFTVSAVETRFLELEEDAEDDAEQDEDVEAADLPTIAEEAAGVIELSFRLDREPVSVELAWYDDMLDLSFLNEIEEHLARIGESRRLCPIVELMDDTARYVFHDPEKVEQAELDEVIAAPDFEDA